MGSHSFMWVCVTSSLSFCHLLTFFLIRVDSTDRITHCLQSSRSSHTASSLFLTDTTNQTTTHIFKVMLVFKNEVEERDGGGSEWVSVWWRWWWWFCDVGVDTKDGWRVCRPHLVAVKAGCWWDDWYVVMCVGGETLRSNCRNQWGRRRSSWSWMGMG